MLTERLQILVTPEQRRRLALEARERGTSAGALVREAIDARFGGASGEERIRAAQAIASMSGGQFLPPEELDRLVEGEAVEELAERPGADRR